MNVREAGQRGGRSSSPAKRAAARRNGAGGGRPKKAELLLRRMRAIYAKIRDHHLDIDPDDLDLIIESMCHPPDERHFFIYPRKEGGYAF